MKAILKNNYGQSNVILVKEKYTVNNATVLTAMTEDNGYPERFATLSVNLIDEDAPPKDYIYFKNYSENIGFLECLEEQKLVERTGKVAKSGFVTVPLVKLLF